MADFLDKVKTGFNKGVATVSTGSKNMIEKTKINTVIKTLEDEKKQLIEILGNKVFAFCTDTEDGDIPRSEVLNICNEIVTRNVQIEEQKQKIEALDAEMNQVLGNSASPMPMVCSCGHTNSVGAKFCAKCGNKLV